MSEHKWFFNVSEIELGGSSVLGENYMAFYTIHILAMSLIVTSLTSCTVVIVSILCGVWHQNEGGKRSRMDFADRFPFYLAVADALWSISHLIDHFYLVTTHRYPSSQIVSILLSINIWTFLGQVTLTHCTFWNVESSLFIYAKHLSFCSPTTHATVINS